MGSKNLEMNWIIYRKAAEAKVNMPSLFDILETEKEIA